MSEMERFFERFAEHQRQGLQDMKLYVTPGSNAGVNDIYAASNRFDKAIDEGNFMKHDTWPYDQEAVRDPLLAD